MKVLKKINRKIFSPLLMNLKADRIIRNFTDNSILNIMYHGVVEKEGNYFSPRHISYGQFEEHLKYFSKEFDVVSISEAFEYVVEGYRPKRKTITISFDDGYRNNLFSALPLLEKYNMKTTVFPSGLCAEEMDIRVLWPDIISCLMLYQKQSVIELGNKKFKNFIDTESKLSLGDFLGSCKTPLLTHYLNYLISTYDIKSKLNTLPDELWKLLNKDELKELSSSGIITIGSHGYSHYNLANIDISDAINELRMSKEVLQKVIGKDIEIIAYPFGDYNNLIKDNAEKIGYKYQMAVNYLNSSDLNDLRILNRFGISSTTTFDANILLLNIAFRSSGYN